MKMMCVPVGESKSDADLLMLKMLKTRLIAAAASVCGFSGGGSGAFAAAETPSEAPAPTIIDQGAALLADALRVVAATLLLLIALWLVRRIRLWTLAMLARRASLPGGIPASLATDLRSQLLHTAQMLARLFSTAVGLVLVYLWLVYSLNQFAYTASWGERSAHFLVNLLVDFGTGAMRAVPGIVAVIIIVLMARWVVRLISMVFREVQSGNLSFNWLERETARTTQTLLVFAVWVFAVVVAYPYIPGSETEAFKGLSVLIGLMITLGSTGLINQVISGLFVIYSRSVRPDDYVRVGDIEGQVVEVGFLATKLKTPRQEEITIPHSVLVGAATTNYSRLAEPDGMVVTASVTIGYDVPWRQVHALLLLGASRTPGIRQQPPPRVVQRELSDFYVQYQVLAHMEEGRNRAAVISELHAQIQDAFNEYGAQIMSPHFESQPDRRVYVPKTEWYAAPAAPSAPTNDAAQTPGTGAKISTSRESD
jgi:small-conductance mechanosensitive channel